MTSSRSFFSKLFRLNENQDLATVHRQGQDVTYNPAGERLVGDRSFSQTSSPQSTPVNRKITPQIVRSIKESDERADEVLLNSSLGDIPDLGNFQSVPREIYPSERGQSTSINREITPQIVRSIKESDERADEVLLNSSFGDIPDLGNFQSVPREIYTSEKSQINYPDCPKQEAFEVNLRQDKGNTSETSRLEPKNGSSYYSQEQLASQEKDIGGLNESKVDFSKLKYRYKITDR